MFRRLFFILNLLISIGALAQAKGKAEPSPNPLLHKWIVIEHKVRPDQNLRSIAKRYYGVRQGAHCVASQLTRKNPNLLRIGEKLKFLAPPRKYRLKEYNSLKLDCSPERVIADDVKTELQPERQIAVAEMTAPLDVEDPEFQPVRFWLRQIMVGPAGVSAATLRQSFGASTVRYESIEAGSVSLCSRQNWTPNWTTNFSVDSTPSLFPGQTSGAVDRLVRSTSAAATASYFPRSQRFQFLSHNVYPFWSLGVQHQELPLVIADEQTSVEVEPMSYQSARGGFGLSTPLSERWYTEMDLNLNHPFAFQRLKSLSSKVSLDGSFKIQRKIGSGPWVLGLNWHGQYLDLNYSHEYRAAEVKGRSEYFHSSLELSFGALF